MTEEWVTASWDGRPIQGIAGEPVAAALWREGILTQTRSIKYHRPRGPQCMTGGCPGCLVRVDGVPNVRGCQEPLEAGQEIESQVGWPSAERDIFSIVDRVFKRFDHERDFVRPGLVRAIYEATARRLSGFGQPPTGTVDVAEGKRLETEVLVVGGGPAGLAAAHEAARAGADVLLVDPGPPGGSLLHTRGTVDGRVYGPSPGPELAEALVHALPDHVGHATGRVFGIYPEAIGLLEEGPSALAAHQVHAQVTILATGANEGTSVVPGNDRPGVLGARGARILMNRWGVMPGQRVAVVDPGHQGTRFLTEARGRSLEVFGLPEVDEIGGKTVVAWVEHQGQRHEADAVILDPGLEPAVELAQQTGIPLTYETALGGRVPLHEPDGSTVLPDTLVAGSLAGLHTPEGALAQGRMAGARAAGAKPPMTREELLEIAGVSQDEAAALDHVWGSS